MYERVVKTVISVGKKAQECQQMHFMAVEKTSKLSGFVIWSYLRDIAFTAVKRYAQFKTRCVKGVPFVNRRNTKGNSF